MILPINYLIYTQVQDEKCYGRIVSYANTYIEACNNLDMYVYNKSPLSVIKYSGNVVNLVPLSVPFLLKHKRDVDNDYGYYIMNSDNKGEWCFVQDCRPLEYFLFSNMDVYYSLSAVYNVNTLYPILDDEMPDYNKDIVDSCNIRYIVYVHFSQYCAGVVIGLCSDYNIAKTVAFKFIKEKLAPNSYKIFITGELFDKPNFFLNHKILSSYIATFDGYSVYCCIHQV
jgi:hypothetical protein